MKLSVIQVIFLAGAVMLAGSVAQLTFQATVNKITEIERLAFFKWQSHFDKTYSSPTEQEYRLSVFADNMRKVQEHQSSEDKSFTLGLTVHADLTSEEFRSKITVSSIGDLESLEIAPKTQESPVLGQTANIDWRSSLQQQSITVNRGCNSNYAWVAAVNMNANYYLTFPSPQRYAFSPQTYLDCSANFGNQGCQGGSTMNAYTYSQSWGIDTLTNYPYFDQQRQCRASTGYFKNRGVYRVTSLSNTEIYNALSSRKVLTVLVDASGMQLYTGGVFKGPCSTNVNHAMLLVGAGRDFASGLDYWLLMNTAGSFWGESGFMRIARFTVDGNPQFSSCGLNMWAHFPTF